MLCFVGIDRITFRKQHAKSLKEGRGGVVAPEHRLYQAMLGSIGIPIGLFWFAWTARQGVHWISPILASIPFAWGNISVFQSSAMFLIDTYGPLNGASALAANGLIRYTLGAVFPLFTIQSKSAWVSARYVFSLIPAVYDRLDIAWATSLLGFVSLLMLPIPWAFFKFGSRLRARSQFDTIKA